MLETPLDDWANGGPVDVFFMYGEYGFSSMVSWSCSRELLWNLRTYSYYIAAGK